jgi:BirA family biotin operon repressor/biotin-[acetyl-CoA-carboxylase] ligase
LSTDRTGRATAWPEGYGLKILESVDSTLDEAQRMGPELTGPVWILARRQTKGRGRRGRAWVDPLGNMASALVVPPTEPPATFSLRSYVAALALYDAFTALTGRQQGFAVKWPNDVLLNGGKLAGILLEGSERHLAIGIGVNLVQAPASADLEPGAVPPVSLAGETGLTIDPEDMLAALAAAYAFIDTQFRTYGFGPVRTAWLAKAARLGQPITARTGTSEQSGTFETVDEEGNLVLRTSKGRAQINAADIFF